MTAVCLQELAQVRRIDYAAEEASSGHSSAVGKTLIKHKTILYDCKKKIKIIINKK